MTKNKRLRDSNHENTLVEEAQTNMLRRRAKACALMDLALKKKARRFARVNAMLDQALKDKTQQLSGEVDSAYRMGLLAGSRSVMAKQNAAYDWLVLKYRITATVMALALLLMAMLFVVQSPLQNHTTPIYVAYVVNLAPNIRINWSVMIGLFSFFWVRKPPR